MTEKEAVEIINKNLHQGNLILALDIAKSSMLEIQQYRAIGTVEECREAMERQMAKKPSYNASGCDKYGNDIWDEWLCPNCGARYEVGYDDYDYCPYCGQAILWENGDAYE